MIKKSQLKSLIKSILTEVVNQQITPAQNHISQILLKKGFKLVKYVPSIGGQFDVILEKPHKSTSTGGERFARIASDGTINQQKMNINQFLQTINEKMTTRAELDNGVMKAVNVEGTEEVKMNPLETYRTAGVKAGTANRRHDSSLASSLMNWFNKAVRMESDKNYAQQAYQSFKDGYKEGSGAGQSPQYFKEMSDSGAVFSGGPTIRTPAWGTKHKDGSKKALDVTTRMGFKKVKSISEETK